MTIEFADDAQDLIAGYRRFRASRYREARDLFSRLRDGQQPATMIIACADSRADPAMIFDAAPGELFTVRNVAALVPPAPKTMAGPKASSVTRPTHTSWPPRPWRARAIFCTVTPLMRACGCSRFTRATISL